MTSIADDDSDVNDNAGTMDIRGVKVKVLQNVLARLMLFNRAERVFIKGHSAVKLTDKVLQIRMLNDKNQIRRREIILNKEMQLLIKPNMKAAIGDRVIAIGTDIVYAVTNVSEHDEYTLTPIKTPEKFKHEANFAHWDWDVDNNIIITNDDFDNKNYKRDTFMTTKDAMEEITKFRTTTTKLSYLELLASDEAQKQNIGKATRFISHAWKYKYEDIVQSLRQRVDPENDYIWFDICTVNQHVWKNVDFQTTFKDAIGDIGHTMLILAPWKNPIPLTRSWCLWEVNSTIETGSKLEVVLPKSQETDFLNTLLNDYKAIMHNLCNIDARNSKAGKEDDEKKIKLAVENTNGGFQAVNQNCYMGIQSGLLDIGKRCMEKLEMKEENDGGKVETKLKFMSNLAMLLDDQGKLNEAEHLYRHTLKRSEEIRGPEHDFTLISVNNFAVFLHRRRCKLKEAEPLLRRVLKGREKIFGLKHQFTFKAVNNLAMLLQNQNKLDEAKVLLQRALKGCEEILGPNHPDTLSTVGNLASLLADQSKLDDAVKLYQRVLKSYEKMHGLRHPLTLTIVGNLGVTLKAQKKLDEAEPLYRRALNGKEEIRGPKHPSTVIAVCNLAVLLQDQHKLEEAELLFRRALSCNEELNGPKHIETLRTVNDLAMLLYDQNKLAKAVILFRRSINGFKEILGPKHEDTLRSMENLALILKKIKKEEETTL